MGRDSYLIVLSEERASGRLRRSAGHSNNADSFVVYVLTFVKSFHSNRSPFANERFTNEIDCCEFMFCVIACVQMCNSILVINGRR